LGAVRGLVHILEAYCKTKKSAKGVHQLQDMSSASLAAAHQDSVQATAHALCPISICYQSAATIHDLVQQVQSLVTEPHALQCLTRIGHLAQFNLTPVVDAADCTARLNSETVWLDASRLPEEVKDLVKVPPFVPGVAPTERGTEFTAPIAGYSLKQHHDMACARAKAEHDI
jgi:hypothetical protein